MKGDYQELYLNKYVQKNELYILLMITVLGFGLRLYKVGKDSFWLDEAGQAFAAIQPHLIDTLMIVRQHAGAMPLDYIVSRFMGSISLNESVMRFPSVLWGTLSIIANYFLVCEFNIPNKKMVSLFVAFMMAVSPVYIQYSQEMRFYSALILFYTLSMLFLIKAIKSSLTRNWLYYIFVTAVGAYFHPYVLLTLLTGFIVILGEYLLHKDSMSHSLSDRRIFIKFFVCNVVLAVLFIPGYLYFDAGQSFSYNLGFDFDSVLKGLGLKAIRLAPGLGYYGLWHVLLMIGTLFGLLLVIKKPRKYYLVFYIVIGYFLQFLLIVQLDVYSHYFFAARQIIHLAILLLVLTSISIVEMISTLRSPLFINAFFVLVSGLLCISSLAYIGAIYNYSKGSGGEIAQKIIYLYKPGQEVAILSSNYKVILNYYFLRFERPGESIPVSLVADDLSGLEKLIRETPNVEYIVVPKDATVNIRTHIIRLGFKGVASKPGDDFLFIRSP